MSSTRQECLRAPCRSSRQMNCPHRPARPHIITTDAARSHGLRAVPMPSRRVGYRACNRSPFARIVSASAAAGPRAVARLRPARRTPPRPVPAAGRPPASPTNPSGISPRACTVTPSPASAAARSPLRLPLEQTMRQARPARSSVSSATVRRDAGRRVEDQRQRLPPDRCACPRLPIHASRSRHTSRPAVVARAALAQRHVQRALIQHACSAWR